MSIYLTDTAKVLRAAGVKVKEMMYERGPRAGQSWERVGYRGLGYPAIPLGVMWHHDASPKGDSYGALDWLLYSASDGSENLTPAANAWVDRKGVWHLYAGGYSNHAGLGAWPKLGLMNNANARFFGVETDHTDGETWTEAQVDSLRAGTAALMKNWNRPSDNVIGHKEWAPGRKSDPDGLDMKVERRRVGKLMGEPQSAWRRLLDKWSGK